MIDSHTHIFKRYYKERELEIKNVLKEVDLLINISFSINSSKEAIQIANKFEDVYATIGIHPSNVKHVSSNYIEELEELLKSKNVLAIGEIGLDYHYKGYSKKLQKKIFIEQIELAKKYNLPVVLHSREANDDVLEIIKDYKDIKFLFHS
jgi:TatD DNase family protein